MVGVVFAITFDYLKVRPCGLVAVPRSACYSDCIRVYYRAMQSFILITVVLTTACLQSEVGIARKAMYFL